MKALAVKLNRIYGKVTQQEKAGTNSAQGYKYFSEAQLQSYLRPLIAEEGLIILNSVEKTTSNRFVTAKGADKVLVYVETLHTIIDSDSGESLQVKGSGEGIDSGDKAVYKAITGAGKYFYMKMFGISDFQDPENEDEVADRLSTAVSPPLKKESPKLIPLSLTPVADDFYRKSLIDLIKKEGIPQDFIVTECHKINWISADIKDILGFPEGKARELMKRVERMKIKWDEHNGVR